jgi:hypothetical protein
MPCAAGQESWAGTATSPGLAMPLSQGHDRQSLSPAGLTRWYRLCAARVFQGDCYERAPWYAAHPPVSTPFLRARVALGWKDAIFCQRRRGGKGDSPTSCPSAETRRSSGEDTPRLGSACGPPRCAAARAARRGEADCSGRKRLGKRASRPMSTGTADSILWYEVRVLLPLGKKKVCYLSWVSPLRCSCCSVGSPRRSRSILVGQDSHAPGVPGSSGRLRARPAPSDAFPGCANDPAQGVHAEGWAALPASSGAACPAQWA